MTDKTITFDRFVRWILGGLLVSGILLTLNYLSDVLLPFVLAWLLAYLVYPLVCFLQYRVHVPGRALSIIVALILITSVIGGILYLIIPPMVEQFDKLGQILTTQLHETTHISRFPSIHEWVAANRDEIERFFRNKEVSDAIRRAMPKVFELVGHTASVIISIVASLITLLYMFFILLDYEVLASGVVKLFPPKSRPFWQALLGDVKRELNSYVRGQSTVAFCIGILICIGFTVIDFPMAIGMGILIGVMSLIPYVHSLALIPIVFLSLLKAADTGDNFWAILFGALAVFAIVPPLTPVALCTIGSLLGEFGMALHLKSPSSCIGEVEMHTVELVMSHGIDLLHHKLLAEEMTAEVEHEATVLESWSVGNPGRWQGDSRLILHISLS